MPLFKVLWSQLTMLLHVVDQDCVWLHVTSKIILLSLTYSRTSRSWAWGCWYVANVSIIFDAPCLFSIQCFDVFYMFSFIFRMFSCTNLLTRCPRPVDVFVVFLFQKSFEGNILGKVWKSTISLFTRNKDRHRRWPGGGQGAPRGH